MLIDFPKMSDDPTDSDVDYAKRWEANIRIKLKFRNISKSSRCLNAPIKFSNGSNHGNYNSFRFTITNFYLITVIKLARNSDNFYTGLYGRRYGFRIFLLHNIQLFIVSNTRFISVIILL